MDTTKHQDMTTFQGHQRRAMKKTSATKKFSHELLESEALSIGELENGINDMCSFFERVTSDETRDYSKALCSGNSLSSRASTPVVSTISSASTGNAVVRKTVVGSPRARELNQDPAVTIERPDPQRKVFPNPSVSSRMKERLDTQSALDRATHIQTKGTFQHLVRGFSRQIDFGLLNVPRISKIVNESTRSTCHRRAFSQEASESLDCTWLQHSPSRRLGEKRSVGSSSTSLAAAIAKRERLGAENATEFHQFVSSNAKKEIVAGTTNNTYHVTKDPEAGADELDRLKIKAKRFQLRRGVFHGGVTVASKSHCAITFAPHRDQASNFQQLGGKSLRSQIAPPIRLRCLLVGELVRQPYHRTVLGGHTNNPICRPQLTTLTSLGVFQEDRRKQLRIEQEERMKSQRNQKASNMIAQMEYKQSKLMAEIQGTSAGKELSDVEMNCETDTDKKSRDLEMDSLVAGNASDDEILQALLGTSRQDKGNKRVDFQKSEVVQEIFEKKKDEESKPYRLHPKLQESSIPGFTPYSGFVFLPKYLAVYEMPTVDPLLLKAKSEETLLRVSYQLKKEKDFFSPMEFTTRWCSLIKDLEGEIAQDGWVRRKVPFQRRYKKTSSEDADPLTLAELLPLIGTGAVSIDVAKDDTQKDGGSPKNDDSDGPASSAESPSSVFYRHSFTFTDLWVSETKE